MKRENAAIGRGVDRNGDERLPGGRRFGLTFVDERGNGRASKVWKVIVAPVEVRPRTAEDLFDLPRIVERSEPLAPSPSTGEGWGGVMKARRRTHADYPFRSRSC